MHGGLADSARHRVSAKCVPGPKLNSLPRLSPKGCRNAVGNQDRREGCISAADSLSARKNVGPNSKSLGREEPSRSPKTRDDLVEDQQDAVAITDFAKAREIIG